MTIGKKIKQARTEKGLTQHQLANLLNTWTQQVSAWERADNITYSNLADIAAALGITVSELVAEAEEAQTA